MSQLYARVFTQILDSSIAEDFTTRHVFEDFFKLCSKDGIVDMTRHAIARRLNMPQDVLNGCIDKLESPDVNSRDPDHDGRRIERLDEHRDWGWRILNWPKYDALRSRADVAIRVARHRETEKPRPTIEEVKAHCLKLGLPESDAEWFFHKCEGNGWTNDGKPIRSWTSTISSWKAAGYMASQKQKQGHRLSPSQPTKPTEPPLKMKRL